MGGPERIWAAILPAGAAAAELVDGGDEDLLAELFDAELTAVADASEGRRREFAGGRACAHRALTELGVGPVAVPAGADGSPVWPDGVVGAITHKGDYRAAAVAFASDRAGLGIDAEFDAPLPAGVLERIAGPAEIEQVERLIADRAGTNWDRLLFSAKEAVVKASGLAPLAAAEVTFDDDGTFSATAPAAGGSGARGALTVDGRYQRRPGFVVAAAWVAATG